MATQPGTVAFLLEQASGAGAISARKMFGECALCCDGKVVGLVCDDQLFVKTTQAGRACLDGLTIEEKPPYAGAKPSFLIARDRWEDAGWLSALIRDTADALPAPKPKKRT